MKNVIEVVKAVALVVLAPKEALDLVNGEAK